MSREKFVPRAKSVERGIVAIREGCVEVLRIMDRGEEEGAIADDELFSSNVGSVEVLARKSAKGCGCKRDKVTNRNDNVRVQRSS